MGHNVHAGRVEPHEEWLVSRLCFVHELQRKIEDLVVYRLHPFWIKRSGIFDLLLADFTPARHVRRVVRIRGPAVDHVAWTDLVQQVLRIVRMRRVFHRVEMIEITEEFIEAVDGGQEFILVTKMVLTELTGRIAQRFERSRDGASFGGY